MVTKLFTKILIVFSCFLFLAGYTFQIQSACGQESSPPKSFKIISVGSNPFWRGGGIHVEGKSFANATILLSVKDENGLFSYSTRTSADSQGNWSAKISQPLKTGRYYVEAAAQNSGGILGSPIRSELIKITGPFGVITFSCSLLIIILLVAFVGIWYASKSAEIKRYRRILASQRDIISCYNALKKDIGDAIKKFDDGDIDASKISEIKFFLKRISENVEKIDKYVLQGISVIGDYDVISKIYNLLKFKKNKNTKT